MKLKKLVAFILAGVMAAALLSACGNSPLQKQRLQLGLPKIFRLTVM